MNDSKSVLLDVNLLLAYGWRSHLRHVETREWVDSLPAFSTCAITELGFLRVSMSPGFRASISESISVLHDMKRRSNCSFLACELPATEMPPVERYKDTTDAYLVALADSVSSRLATLDQGIVKAEWGKDVAFNPFP